MTATRAVLVCITTYHYLDRPEHTRTNVISLEAYMRVATQPCTSRLYSYNSLVSDSYKLKYFHYSIMKGFHVHWFSTLPPHW